MYGKSFTLQFYMHFIIFCVLGLYRLSSFDLKNKFRNYIKLFEFRLFRMRDSFSPFYQPHVVCRRSLCLRIHHLQKNYVRRGIFHLHFIHETAWTAKVLNCLFLYFLHHTHTHTLDVLPFSIFSFHLCWSVCVLYGCCVYLTKFLRKW